ncbi:MAG: hypothetical protein IKQ55_10280 [Kiritimatiellae bacterium]|nr:hypothetical protein [Kiritimatiellia bacterium]
MKNGRMLAAAGITPRFLACIGLALSVALFCDGCVTRFHSTSFDVKHKPASSGSATNFRVQAVSDDEHDREFENALKAELQKLEKGQNPSLPPVPYSVDLRYLGLEETSDGTKMLTGLLFLGSCFVFPHWDTSTHKWEISTTLPGEKTEFRGERSTTDIASWFLLPLGLRDLFSSEGPGSGSPPWSESMAKAIFDSLTQARYDKAVSAMRLKAKQRLLGGKRLSGSEERLLEDDTSLDILVARAKHPATKNSGLSALARIDDPETLADIAIHSSVPEIRQTAADRVSGLPEQRYAALASESGDLDVAARFLDRVSGDAPLSQVVQTRSSLPEIKSAAIGKIRQESVLAGIAKSPVVHPSLKQLAVGRIGTEAVLADIAAHAPDADARKAAVGKIDNPAFLVASVAKDPEQENRLAALDRIKHPKALEAIVRKSGDAEVRLRTVRKITDPAVLKEVVASDADEAVRLAAVGQSADQDVFRRATQTDSSPAVREAAVGKLSDAAAIGEIAQSDASAGVRRAAVAKTGDQSILSRIARNDPASEVRLLAVQRLQAADVLQQAATNDQSAEVRAAAVAKIGDPVFLTTIAQQDADASVRRSALARVDDQSILAEIAKADTSAENRKWAVERLDDETALRGIVLGETDASVRRAALGRVVDQGFLAQIAKTDPDPETRKAAIRQLDDEALLREVALSAEESEVREAAIRKLPEDARKMVRNTLNRSAEADAARLVRQALMATGSSKEDIQTLEAVLKFQAALGGASPQEIQDAFPEWEDSGEANSGSWLESFGEGFIDGSRRGMESWNSPGE